MKRIFLIASLMLTIAAFSNARADQGCPKTSVAQIETEVMCPICGTPLAVSQSPQAERERAFIQRLVDQCRDKKQIENQLVAQYGTAVLASPKKSGFELAAYVVPIGAIIISLASIGLLIIRWRRRSNQNVQSTQIKAPRITDFEMKRLTDDMAESESG